LFDELFRQHLRNVYAICGHVAPAILERPITTAKVIQRYTLPTQLIAPRMTGYSTYFDWLGAGCYQAGSEQGAMHRADRFLETLWFGFSEDALYLRLDLTQWDRLSLIVAFFQPRGFLLKT